MEEVNSYLPGINVDEKNEEIIVRIDIPGVKEENIKLSVEGNFLNVDVSEKSEKKIKKKNYFANEWIEGSFSGSIFLPAKVVPTLIHRSYDGKVLEVRLKKF